MIIGCDFHTRYQQIAMLDESAGELIERRLDHESGEAHTFYQDLQGPVRVGIEATGPIRWFERLLAELGHELWISVSVSPSSRTVTRGNSTNYTVTVASINGFNGPVALRVRGLPFNSSASFNPSSVTGQGTSTMTISTNTSTSTGTFSLRIRGTNGGATHSVTVQLVVQ
jgi:hypothetical protein